MLMHSAKQKIKSTALNGFTLMELLVAVTLATLVAGISYAIFDYAQRSNVRIINTANLQADEQLAQTLIRTKLGVAEATSITSANGVDGACLSITNTERNTYTGFWFDGMSTYVSDTDFFGVSGNNDRTISFWIWVPSNNASQGVIAKWGKHNAADKNYAAMVNNNSRMLMDYSGNQMAAAETELNNARWQHVMVTYGGQHNDSHSKIFIDGVPIQNSTWIDQDNLNTGSTSTDNDGFWVGARDASSNLAFRGAIGDVRVWDKVLDLSYAQLLHTAKQGGYGLETDNLLLHWSMNEVPTDNLTVPDRSLNSNVGQINGFDLDELIFQTTEESTVGNSFGFYQTNLPEDDRYSLFYGEGKLSCPNDPASSTGWTRVSDPIYDAPAHHFFSSTDNSTNPSALTLSAGLTGEKFATGQTAKAQKINNSVKIKHSDLCRIDPNLTFDTQAIDNVSCAIKAAYALIEENYETGVDELYVQDATRAETNTEITFTNIPFLPSTVQAKWYKKTGILKFFSTDDGAFDPAVWTRALQTVSMKQSGTKYNSKKKILFSLGYVPFETENGYHYYDFRTTSEGSSKSWTSSFNEARSTSNNFCGLRGYLATITSQAENAFLAERFLTSSGGLPRGWIGGADNDTEGDWLWMDGPEQGVKFYSGATSSGKPVSVNGNVIPTSDFNRVIVDFDPSVTDLKLQRTIPSDSNVQTRFHYFAENEPNNCCGNEDYLQICGLPQGNGVWNDLTGSESCVTNDEFGDVYKVCGYYVEWGGRPGETDPSLVEKRVVDVGQVRDYCK